MIFTCKCYWKWYFIPLFLKLVVKVCAQHIFLPPAFFANFGRMTEEEMQNKKNATATLLRKSCPFFVVFHTYKVLSKVPLILESHAYDRNQITNIQFLWFEMWKKIVGDNKHYSLIYINNLSGIKDLDVNRKKCWLLLRIFSKF